MRIAANISDISSTMVAISLLLCSIIAPSVSFQQTITVSSSVGSFNRYSSNLRAKGSSTCRVSATASSNDGETERTAATASTDIVCSHEQVSRRRLFSRTLTSLLASNAILGSNSLPAAAKVVAYPFSSIDSTAAASIPQQRNELLQAIANKSSDEVVAQAIQNLIPLNPLKSSSPSEYSSALDGEWKLLWYNKSDFSPLLKLPSPLRPDSYQYFGKIAEQEVGEGRVAQGLVGGVVALSGGPKKELWLSSGALASKDDPSVLEIYPPFRFQLGETPGSNSAKSTIVESESDADFRAANARTVEAQQAPKNEYEQVYLENYGSGSLRVSVITKGDPVIVGDMFVHQKV
mmetsp:Transcript_15652/g.25731  ORF Transcript_15652/g.25731 Transcript_15652/m.25731 type:complete len:348 (+) Transcript_15652:169-1212(+)